mmetsp:Transcript_11745/g.14607  ORF Transcript_11745/g.14607 Transcript_11745/m.14607 type:complete len:240 (-) Transcript_11745:124-843(-)|eukprot:CAMPEP_0172501570 /NCGR_PEP_ID=MMETSP1066-20121228/151092_1 /TAXON_ID=671091 /ORGANISM="Coscinodiscus wailesii, Strain CCMP2513" /LENGTH=239 /DNA_ID=CAMNT_0013276409 /DNA_START=50 /DNA_END=769 /DNA_ORIENTATION=-
MSGAPKIYRIAISLCAVFALYNILIDPPSPDGRGLRFFDPHHKVCGDDKEHHDFGIHSLYGDVDVQYYLNYTVTTDEDLDPLNHTEMNKVMQALTYVAVKTNRHILPKVPVIDEDKFPGSESKQPWALIDAGYVKKLGSKLVEPNYWARASGARGHKPRRMNATLGETNALANMDKFIEKLKKKGNATDEAVFNKTELLLLDSDALGERFGEDGGYVNGKWSRGFTCTKKVVKLVAVPI